VAIVNRTLALRYFAAEDPIGKRIYHDWAPDNQMEIVGMVADIQEGPVENGKTPVLYVPFDQNPKDWFAVLVRTSGNGDPSLSGIPAAIREIDSEIAVSAATTMTDRIENSPAAYLHRSSAWLVVGFAAVALVLGVVGLYGVVAYSVSHRTREIGVRMALGANRRAVYRLILSEAARLIGAGAVLGTICSLAAARLIGGLFYGLQGWDAETFAAAAIVLIAAGLAASYLPARQAASTEPIEALRSE
jgi:hypothetical protein